MTLQIGILIDMNFQNDFEENMYIKDNWPLQMYTGSCSEACMILCNTKLPFDHGYVWWKIENIKILESACNLIFNYIVNTEIVGYIQLIEAAKSLLWSSDGLNTVKFLLSVCTFTKVVDLLMLK